MARTFTTNSNLPPIGDDFIGRERYLESVMHSVLDTRAWIISIDGIGGVGKSRLALEVGHRVRALGRYAGIVWVSAKSSWLTPSGIEIREPSFSSLDDLFRQVIKVAGEPEHPSETFEERKARVYRVVSTAPYLLIVDNLETVRGNDRKHLAEFLDRLSDTVTGDTKALVTSREVTNAGAIVTELSGFEFAEGAQLIKQDARNYSDSSLLSADDDILKEIWRGCGGLPLAIKWTVAKVAHRKLGLSETLSELRQSEGNVLEYIFGSVFDSIGDDAKSVLYTASAFVTSVSDQALREIANLSPARVSRAVAELLSLYVVHRIPQLGPRTTTGERYEMLPATRVCVEAVCEDNPGLSDSYFTRATEYCSRLWAVFTPSFGLEQFEYDYDNSAHLLDHSFAAQRWEAVIRLAKGLDSYASVRGLVEDRIEICNLGIQAARYLNDGKSVFELKQAKGKAYKQKGMYQQAEQELRECLAFYDGSGMAAEAVRVRMQLGIVAEHQVEYSASQVDPDVRQQRLSEALAEYSEASDAFKGMGDIAGCAQSLHLMGRVLRKLHRFTESEEKLLASLTLKRELGDAVRTAITEHELARLYVLTGRQGEAETLYSKAIATLTEFGATKDVANAKWGFSLLLRNDTSRLSEAVTLNREAAESYGKQGRRPKFEFAESDWRRAVSLLEEAQGAKEKELPDRSGTVDDAGARELGPRNRLFISYSRADSDWLKRLRVHLRPLERRGIVDLFDDSKILPGRPWRAEIESALNSARFAVLLVSADFLASDFIAENELPQLLGLAERGGATILPVIVSPCGFEQDEALSQFQAVNPPSRPLASLGKSDQEEVFAKVARVIVDTLSDSP